MSKELTIVFLLLGLSSCAPETKTPEFSDDYVLVEFAARLEEDYERLYPQPLEKDSKSVPQ